MKKGFLFVLTLGLIGGWCFSQATEEITLKEGFRIEKILETNKAADCMGITFDDEGNLIVATWMWSFLQVTPEGEISTLARLAPNKDPDPFDVLFAEGKIYFTNDYTLGGPGLYRLEDGKAVRMTLVNTGGELEEWRLNYIVSGEPGELYSFGVNLADPGTRYLVRLTDKGGGCFLIENLCNPLNERGLVYRDGHIYVVAWDSTDESYGIASYKTDGTDEGFLFRGLYSLADLVMDSHGCFYTRIFDHQDLEGYGYYNYYDIVKISHDGSSHEIIADDIRSSCYLGMDSNDVLYISEFENGLISKIEPYGDKEYITQDFGHNLPCQVAFDSANRPYVSSFRQSQLKRIDPETRTLETVTPPLGNCNQNIAVDENGLFYMSNGRPAAIYRVDPQTGAVDFIIDFWSRALRFDSFGRLIITSEVFNPGPSPEDAVCTAGIVNLDEDPVTITPYITGIRNLERGFLFDDQQNFYVKRGRGDGIIKVFIDETPKDPPIDLSDEELFIDLSAKEAEISFFDRTAQGELLIPLRDIGELVLAYPDGSWEDFASGFSFPCCVSFDHNGIAYINDGTSGVFRIIGEAFVVPTVVKRLEALCTYIYNLLGDKGLGNSLCKKLTNASKSLERGQIKAGINALRALDNELRSLCEEGKISLEDALRWQAAVKEIIAGLELL